MARTITQVKAGMTADFMANETIAGFYGFAAGADFDSVFSKVSLESILFYIVASAIYVMESLFDVLKTDVDTALSQRLTHNRQWYVNIAKAFQFGDGLDDDTGKYPVIDETKMVVAYAAVDEVNGQLILKVASEADGELGALTTEELTGFENYIQKVKDAGVKVTVVSTQGDALRLVIDILYDPMVLGVTVVDGVQKGYLLSDGNTEPVKNTIKSFIKQLPFNGEFKTVSLVDALQVTPGVVIPTVESAESKYAANDWQVIDARVKPYAGYLVIADENLSINYRPYDAN